MKKDSWAFNIWKEGKYLDFWLIIHIIDGMLMAGIGILIGINFLTIFLISLGISLLWEFIEPPEHIYNKILDVITSLGGLIIFYFGFGKNNVLITIVLILAISLNFWAWILTKNYKNFYKKV
jgi:hypothetical protein